MSNQLKSDKRWQEILDTWNEHSWLSFFVIFILGFTFGFILGARSNLDNWFIDGFWAEALGIVITVGIIGTITKNIEKNIARRQFEEYLLRDAKSSSNDRAKAAITLLRDEGLVFGKDSRLRNANLMNSDLRGVNLMSANLENAKLMGADLRGAYLAEAKIDNAVWGIEIRDVFSPKEEISGSIIIEAAILPDGTRWTPDEDVRRFVDVLHPDYYPTLHKIGDIRLEMGLPKSAAIFHTKSEI